MCRVIRQRVYIDKSTNMKFIFYNFRNLRKNEENSPFLEHCAKKIVPGSRAPVWCHDQDTSTSGKHTYINSDPLKPHFYIVKMGFTRVYIIFLISAQKHRLWVLVRTASERRF